MKTIPKDNMCIYPAGWGGVLLDTEVQAGVTLKTVLPLLKVECEMKLLVKMDGFCSALDTAL